MALVEHYSALMEADHLAAIGKKVADPSGRTAIKPQADVAQELEAEQRGRGDWRGTQSRRELDEDRYTAGSGAIATTEAREAIQGRPHRAIPKGAVGRSGLTSQARESGQASGGVRVKLGAQDTVLHRPQGFGGGRGSGAISFG